MASNRILGFAVLEGGNEFTIRLGARFVILTAMQFTLVSSIFLLLPVVVADVVLAFVTCLSLDWFELRLSDALY